MLPEVGWSNPAIRRRLVVLPDPDGPSRVKNSPSRTSRSMLSTALTSPKWRLTPESRTAGMDGLFTASWAPNKAVHGGRKEEGRGGARRGVPSGLDWRTRALGISRSGGGPTAHLRYTTSLQEPSGEIPSVLSLEAHREKVGSRVSRAHDTACWREARSARPSPPPEG